MESKEKLRKSFKENDRLKIKARPVNSSQNRCVILDTASPGDQGVHEEKDKIIRTTREKYWRFGKSSR